MILKTPVTENDHLQGSLKAPILLVEYGDYQCPYCHLAIPVVKELQEHFGKQLCFVFRNFPLKAVHPYAEIAAESAEFAADNERFWEMHDLIYEYQQKLSPQFLLELSETIGLSAPDLRDALENESFQPRVYEDFMGGVRSGVNGTPTFFINGSRYNGAVEYEEIAAAIDSVFVKQT